MKLWAIPLTLVCALAVTALADDPLMRVRIEAIDGPGLAAELERAGYDVLEGSVTDSTLDLVVSATWLARLEAQGYKPQLVAVGRPYADIQADYLAQQRGGGDSLPTGYPDLAGIYSQMQAIAAAHPDICQFVDLTTTYNQPTTYEGRHLYACKVSGNVTQNENEPGLLIIADHHAREITTPTICLYALERLTTLYGTDPAVTAAVNGWEIWIAPTWNPDGYNYCWTTDNMWRKNRHVFSGGTGVDQNRNYPIGWDTSCAGDTDPSSEDYKGPSAGSEAETRTLIAWSQDRHFTKVIDYHSYGQQVLRGYNCHTHPFDAWFETEAHALAVASNYSTTRDPSAEGEQYQWQFAVMGAGANLIETNTDFQPSWSSSQAEAALVWPGILWSFSHPIPLWGWVTDAATGAPVAANIELVGVTYQIPQTNPTGRFGRYNVFAPPGTYTLSLTAPGYDNLTVPNVVITTGTSTHLDIQMLPPPDFVYPNGGEHLTVNQPVNVTWTSRGPTQKYQVQSTTNYGLISQITDSFERASLGTDYTTGGNANWYITNSYALVGTRSARAGAIANSQTSWMTRTVSGGNLSFWYLVSSEANGDYFNFYVDGSQVVHASGAGAWAQYTTTLSAGTHELKWEYAKNAGVSQGNDTVFIDYLQMVANNTTWTDVLTLSAVGQTSTTWTPTVLSTNCKLRIRSYYPSTAYYGPWGETDATFTVATGPAICRGDTDCDGAVNFADIDYFVASIPDNQAAWVALYQTRHSGANPPCSFSNCDINNDGHVNFSDIDPFVAKIPSACP